MPWGFVSEERLAAGGRSKSPHPQTPFTGDALLEDRHLHPASKIRPDYLSCPGPLGPTQSKILRHLR